MTSVRLIGIGKRYPNGFEAVQNLDLEVQSGEFIALVGPSGCGKSTTLRMIAGLEDISSGELLIDDERANEKAPKDRGVAMVFQSYALYPHMSVRENIAFALKLQKMPQVEIDQRVEAVAKKLQIFPLLDRKPKEMSGGQRQRVAMARAIARQPKIFLFDEPLSNLDAQLRAEMRVEITKLQNELKTTSFYVTHDQVEAMTLADRVVLLKSGVVQQIGAPLELHDQPANRFVATFIGSPTMNMLRTELKLDGLQVCGVHLSLSTKRLEHIQAQGIKSGMPIDLGIRPHQMTLVALDEQSKLDEQSEQAQEQTATLANGIKVSLEAIEPLGSETICYCRPIVTADDQESSEQRLVVKLDADRKVERGQIYLLSFKEEHIHLFNADEEGVRLS